MEKYENRDTLQQEISIDPLDIKVMNELTDNSTKENNRQKTKTDFGYIYYKIKNGKISVEKEVIKTPIGDIIVKNGIGKANFSRENLKNFLLNKGYTEVQNPSQYISNYDPNRHIVVKYGDDIQIFDIKNLDKQQLDVIKFLILPTHRLIEQLNKTFGNLGMIFRKNNENIEKTFKGQTFLYTISPTGLKFSGSIQNGYLINTGLGELFLPFPRVLSPEEFMSDGQIDREKVAKLFRGYPILEQLAREGVLVPFHPSVPHNIYGLGTKDYNRLLTEYNQGKTVFILRSDNTPYLVNGEIRFFGSSTPPLYEFYRGLRLPFYQSTMEKIREDSEYEYYPLKIGQDIYPAYLRKRKTDGHVDIVATQPQGNLTSHPLYQRYLEMSQRASGTERIYLANGNAIPIFEHNGFLYLSHGAILFRVSPTGTITRMGFDAFGNQAETSISMHYQDPYTEPITNHVHPDFLPYFLRNSRFVSRNSYTEYTVWDPDDQGLYRVNVYNRQASFLGTQPRTPVFTGNYNSGEFPTILSLFIGVSSTTNDIIKAITRAGYFAPPASPLTTLLESIHSGRYDAELPEETLLNLAKNLFSSLKLSYPNAGFYTVIGNKRIENVDDLNKLNKRELLSIHIKTGLNQTSIYEFLNPSNLSSLDSRLIAIKTQIERIESSIHEYEKTYTEILNEIEKNIEIYAQKFGNSRKDYLNYIEKQIDKLEKLYVEYYELIKKEGGPYTNMYLESLKKQHNSTKQSIKKQLKIIDDTYAFVFENKQSDLVDPTLKKYYENVLQESIKIQNELKQKEEKLKNVLNNLQKSNYGDKDVSYLSYYGSYLANSLGLHDLSTKLLEIETKNEFLIWQNNVIEETKHMDFDKAINYLEKLIKETEDQQKLEFLNSYKKQLKDIKHDHTVLEELWGKIKKLYEQGKISPSDREKILKDYSYKFKTQEGLKIFETMLNDLFVSSVLLNTNSILGSLSSKTKDENILLRIKITQTQDKPVETITEGISIGSTVGGVMGSFFGIKGSLIGTGVGAIGGALIGGILVASGNSKKETKTKEIPIKVNKNSIEGLDIIRESPGVYSVEYNEKNKKKIAKIIYNAFGLNIKIK